MRELKNYLAEENTSMSNKIFSFIRRYSSLPRVEMANIERFINDIMVFELSGDQIVISEQDETLYKSINLLKIRFMISKMCFLI